MEESYQVKGVIDLLSVVHCRSFAENRRPSDDLPQIRVSTFRAFHLRDNDSHLDFISLNYYICFRDFN